MEKYPWVHGEMMYLLENKYKKHSLLLFLTFFFFTFFEFFFISHGDCEDLSSKDLLSIGRLNYYELKEAFDNWDLGLYGSRKYYRRRLNSFLTKKIGEYIRTEMDYKISIYDLVEKKYYSSDLYNQKWLHIHGEADKESLKYLIGKGDNFIRDMELKKYLFFISGKIKTFRIRESDYGRSIHLYLESVKISDSVNQ